MKIDLILILSLPGENWMKMLVESPRDGWTDVCSAIEEIMFVYRKKRTHE